MRLNKEIADSMPFMSRKISMEELKEKWKDNKFYDSFGTLIAKYSQARELRRDGNCFYRALLWQLFEYFLINKSEEANAEYEKIYQKIKGSKEDLLKVGYDEIVVETFYDVFLEEFEKLKDPTIDTQDEESVHQYLETIFGNDEKSPYMIVHCRYMTSCYLKENSILYENFIVDYPDVATYCQVEVEGIDREAEQLAIIAITSYLEIAAEINQVRDNGHIETLMIPEDAVDDGKRFIAKLLFTPGHYDALYS